MLSSVLDVDTDEALEDELDVHNNIKRNKNTCVFINRCPYNKPICSEKKPDNIIINGNHIVKCHFGGTI